MHRAQFAAALFAFFTGAALAGCSGGNGAPLGSTSNPDGGTEDGGYNEGWDGQTNIEAIFAANCSGCHGTGWASCWNVQASSQEVESAVSSGAMPRGGALSAPDKSTLLTWLSAGANCTGPRENPNGGGGGSGGGVPVVAGETAGTGGRPTMQ
jgi:hypothetical protein